MIDEPIHLSPWHDSWPSLAAAESSHLASALSVPPGQIEHIGSTAIPGLLAKPILDLQVGLSPFPPSGSLLLALAACGYTDHGEAGVPGRLYFTARQAIHVNVHVVQLGGEHWRNNLLLRQYLRASAAARQRYASAKAAAVAGGADTLRAYSETKAAVVAQLLVEARSARSIDTPQGRP